MVRQRPFAALLGTLVVAGGTFAQESDLPASFGSAVNAANLAHVRYDAEGEYRQLLHAATLEGAPRLHAGVQRRLAVLEWRVLGRVEEGRSRLRLAASSADPAEAWLALARLEQAQRNFPAAQMAADRALAAAADPATRDRAQLAFLRSIVAGAAASEDHPARGTGAIEFARDELDARVTAAPGELEPSRLLLRAALLTDAGDAARKAWRSYHHVFAGSPMPRLLASPGSALDSLLAELTSGATDTNFRIDLVKALAGVRFIQEAALVARDPRLAPAVREDPNVSVILVYADALEWLGQQVEEYYRRQILDDYDPDSLSAAVREASGRVWRAVYGEHVPLPGDDQLRLLLERRFGVVVELTRTNRRFDLRMGHLVADEMRQVEQDDRSARVRYVSLDNMVSFGFRDWAWEHRRGARGFASTTTITQIRPLYVPEALRAWELATDPAARAQLERNIAAETPRDDARARANPHGYLPGLDMRLQQLGRDGLLEELRTQGLVDDRLRAAFLLDYQSALTDSSIVAHEGRHALDLGRRGEYHREFAAKIAEIALAPRPRLAFASIIDPSIGDGSFHGTGNELVMQAMVRWIDAHRDEITGFDADRPLLPQLDLLTPEQLRQAAADSDPRNAVRGSDSGVS